jgi:hypothetical protein
VFARLRQRLAREDGVALVLALLIVAALTISTAAIVTLTSSNQRAFARDKLEERAFNTAEEAFNVAISTLRSYDNGTVAAGSTYGSSASPVACCNSLGGWWAVKASASEWEIFSTGLSPNGDVLRKLSVRTTVDTTTVTTTPSLAWGFGFFVANPPSCTSITGTAAITVSTFINGDLCMSGTNLIEEPNSSGQQYVELYVKGKLYVNGTAQVGTSTRPILLANIVGGCVRTNQNRICSQSAQSKVYASSYGSTQSTLTKPTVDPPGTYASGVWSSPVCSVGSFTFDDNTTRDTSVGDVDLFPASSYDCTVNDSGGGYVGRLTWDASTSVLTIDGVIYIDGNMALNGGDQAQYTGSGTIFVNGTVTTNGNSALCGPGATLASSSCTGAWDPDIGALSIVAVNASGVTPAWQMNGNAEYNILAYVVGHFSQTGTAFVTGPVITDSASIGGTSEHTDVENPPVGTPGSSTTTTTSDWRVVPGSWEQLPNDS